MQKSNHKVTKFHNLLEKFKKNWQVYAILLTLKVPITTAAENNFTFYLFSENSLNISCESSAEQMIHMKGQDLFSVKTK